LHLLHCEPAGLADFLDFPREVFSDSRQALEFLARSDHCGCASWQIVNGLSRRAISADAEGVCSLNFKQIGKAPEKLRNISIIDGSDAASQCFDRRQDHKINEGVVSL
jgi:hypothetical protein